MNKFVVFVVLILTFILFINALMIAMNNQDFFIEDDAFLMLRDKIEQSRKIPIFYNLYIHANEDIPRVEALFNEQLSYLKPEYHGEVQVTSIGVPLPNITKPATLLQHHVKGNELLSLDAVWEFCTDNPSSKVIYLHSKGSFHPRPENERLRNLLTRAVTSKECANLPDTCNVCSFRMSPFPHVHAPGNMWLARCSYIQQLIKPSLFRKMSSSQETASNFVNSCAGVGRYAAEHWVHAHPNNKPCDLYAKNSFIWDYYGIPTLEDFEASFEFAAAPRFGFKKFKLKKKCRWRYNGEVVVKEYQRVYNMTPSNDWWGWAWYNFDNSTPTSSMR